MDIIPFNNNANVPAFLQGDTTNNDLLQHTSSSFASMSIKGKCFAVVKDGTRTVLKNPKDPESNASAIDVILLKVSPHKSKSFYANGYNENAEDQRPTCYSSNGITPDASVEHPQCSNCANCPHNAWGSAGGSSKGKACADYIRIALAEPSALDEPILLRVPPASIRAVGEYGKQLARHKVPYQGTLTRVSFVPEEATPRLKFTPIGFVTEEMYREVLQASESEAVRVMVFGDNEGQNPVPVTQVTQKVPAPNPQPMTHQEAVADRAIESAMGKVRRTTATAQSPVVQQVQPAPQPVVQQVQPVQQVAQPVAQPAPAPQPAKQDEVMVVDNNEDLGAVLASLDLD